MGWSTIARGGVVPKKDGVEYHRKNHRKMGWSTVEEVEYHGERGVVP